MSLIEAITIDPPLRDWRALTQRRPEGDLLGRSHREWREITRRELDLPLNRPIIATGHQPTLWHPGILAKYIACDAFARAHGLAAANLVVDQDVADIDGFDIPMRRSDGALASRRIELRSERPSADVPLGAQRAFDPLPLPQPLQGAIESVETGAHMIYQRLAAHAQAGSAAEQVAAAFDDLMRPLLAPLQRLMAGSLMHTSLTRALMLAMIDDPHRCAAAYNRAIATEPQARMTPLLIRDDYVELPLWRLREDDGNGSGSAGARMRAYDNDVERALADAPPQAKIQNPKSRIPMLLPRALFMTALARLAAFDLFIHGLGGAIYDRAMERWMREWLGVDVAPMAVVSATLRLPLISEADLQLASPASLAKLRREAREAWHDPDALLARDRARPSVAKRALLERLESAPRGSLERRRAFHLMHEHLQALRGEGEIVRIVEMEERARRLASDAAIAQRRDWAFPLYPPEMLEALKGPLAV